MAVRAHCDRCNQQMQNLTSEQMAEILRKKQQFICGACLKKDEAFDKVAEKWKHWAQNEVNKTVNVMKDGMRAEIAKLLKADDQ